MASHHHYCHHPATAPPHCYCATQCCYAPATYPSCHHNSPPPPAPDFHSHFSVPSQHPRPPRSHLYPNQSLHPYPHHVQEYHFQEDPRIQPTVSSLLRRIASLEAALRRCSTSTPFSASQSLRVAAARTIQTHFRAFLLRRSITLRQLKDLASIKSKLKILKSSVLEKTHFDYGVAFHKATNLLLKLDSIRGVDPMIRDGRNAVRRDLNQFLGFIDEVYCVERKVLSSNKSGMRNNLKARVLNGERNIGNAKFGAPKAIYVEKFNGLVEHIDKLAEELGEEESEPIERQNVYITRKQNALGNRSWIQVKNSDRTQPKVAKSVRFSENGNVYRVLSKNHEPDVDEDCDYSIDSENKVENDLSRNRKMAEVSLEEAENEDEEEHSESGEGFLICSDAEVDRGKSNFGRNRFDEAETDNYVFTAPQPAKMEKRLI